MWTDLPKEIKIYIVSLGGRDLRLKLSISPGRLEAHNIHSSISRSLKKYHFGDRETRIGERLYSSFKLMVRHDTNKYLIRRVATTVDRKLTGIEIWMTDEQFMHRLFKQVWSSVL